jgi:hypothetical protein
MFPSPDVIGHLLETFGLHQKQKFPSGPGQHRVCDAWQALPDDEVEALW